MVTESFYVVLNFSLYITEKIIVKEGISLTSEHKVLPNENTLFIAKVVEGVAFVVSAASDSYHIHI